MRQSLFLIEMFLLSAVAWGCGPADKPLPVGKSQTVAWTIEAPDELFRLHCSKCHGDGSGNGHMAGTLPVAPRNLRLETWQARVTELQIAGVIRDGGTVAGLHATMPAFREKLTEEQIQGLVHFIRQWKPL
jgi:mono/diheme cytochrome c family protein